MNRRNPTKATTTRALIQLGPACASSIGFIDVSALQMLILRTSALQMRMDKSCNLPQQKISASFSDKMMQTINRIMADI